jgi:hypothetical protein
MGDAGPVPFPGSLSHSKKGDNMDFDKINIIDGLQALVDNRSWFWRADTMKLDRIAAIAETRTPWVYWHSNAVDCYFWNDILFKLFGILPSYCMECYKIVVVPNNVVQLFALCDLQERIEGFPCKCGVEPRDDVNRNYGGYFYNVGLKKAKERFPIMREMVDKYVGKDVKMGLKRACTEYERKFGRSDEWKIPEGQVEFEKRVKSHLTDPPKIAPQPDDFKKHIKDIWIKFAHSRGDMSYTKFTNGVPIFEPYVLYAGEL